MSKSGLFAHFGSKQELQLATVEAAATRFRRAGVEAAAGGGGGGARPAGPAAARPASAGVCFGPPPGAGLAARRGPVRDAIAAALDAWLGVLERQARLAGLEDPDRVAFELYALVMGANSRFRLTGDQRVFTQARAAISRLLAEVPG